MNITNDKKKSGIVSAKVLIDNKYSDCGSDCNSVYGSDRSSDVDFNLDFNNYHIGQIKIGGNGNNNNDDNDDGNRRKRRRPPINTCIIDSDKVARLFYKYSLTEDDKYRLMGIFPDVESCIKYLDTGVDDKRGQNIIIDKGIVNKIDSIIVYINKSIENDVGDVGMIKKRYPLINTIVFTYGEDERVYG